MHAGLSQFEAGLTQAEKLTQNAAPLADVFQSLTTALRQIEDIPHCAGWLLSDVDCQRILCEGIAGEESEEYRQTIRETVSGESCRTILSPYEYNSTATAQDIVFGDTILKAVPLSDRHTLALEVRLAAQRPASELMVDASTAVLDCLASSVCRELLSLSQQQVSALQSLNTLSHLFYQQSTDQNRQRVLVDELRAVLGIDRVCLLSRVQSGPWHLVAASGADLLDAGSADSVAIEETAQLLETQQRADQWVNAEREDLRAAKCLQTLNHHGVEEIFVSSLVAPRESQRQFLLLLECYRSPAPALETTLLSTKHSELLLQNGFRHADSWRQMFSRKSNILLSLAALMIVLLCWRTDFEIEVSGQAFPQDRVRVFAPADGVVESLAVSNGAAVNIGQELLTIRSEDLNLAIQQTRGRLRVEKTRLIAAERARGLNSDTDIGRAASEAAIKQAIGDLEIQESMLNVRLQELSLTSTVVGTVVRANLRDELASRPVRRGQVLFEIVPSTTPWQLELHIPDTVIGYVRDRFRVTPEGPRVRFYPRMLPHQSFVAPLTGVDDYVQRSDSQFYCEAQVIVPEQTLQNRTPGMSVTARIDCGSSSMAFVWFRELLEFVREQKFAWF